jgi:uncharacterized protein YchJ
MAESSMGRTSPSAKLGRKGTREARDEIAAGVDSEEAGVDSEEAEVEAAAAGIKREGLGLELKKFGKKIIEYLFNDNQGEKKPELGRNDVCWCGSGEKYKRCHLERDEHKRRMRNDLHRRRVG